MTKHDDFEYTEEERAEIDMCLNCAKEKCNDCISRAYAGRNMKLTLDGSGFAERYNAGTPITEIARLLRMNVDTLYKRMRSYNLPAGPSRPVIGRDTFEALDRDQRRFITWKGERLA